MYHYFSTEIAKQYGLEESILLENIYFWVKKNKANNQNYHNNKYWSYNSIKAFKLLFDYMSESKIYRALKKLEEVGLIEIGDFNADRYKRPSWYTVTDKTLKLYKDCSFQNETSTFQNETSTFQNETSTFQNETSTFQNETSTFQNETSTFQNEISSITDNKQQIKNTNKKQQIKEQFTPPTLEDVAEYCKERNNNIDAMQFVDYYSARGWRFKNGVKMKDWRATVRTWEHRNFSNPAQKDFFGDEDKKTF